MTARTYEQALHTLVDEAFNRLTVNERRTEQAQQWSILSWRGFFAELQKEGKTPQDAMKELLDNEESNKERAGEITSWWNGMVAKIEAYPRTTEEKDDSSDNDPGQSTESFLQRLKREGQQRFSIPEPTTRKEVA